MVHDSLNRKFLLGPRNPTIYETSFSPAAGLASPTDEETEKTQREGNLAETLDRMPRLGRVFDVFHRQRLC